MHAELNQSVWRNLKRKVYFYDLNAYQYFFSHRKHDMKTWDFLVYCNRYKDDTLCAWHTKKYMYPTGHREYFQLRYYNVIMVA